MTMIEVKLSCKSLYIDVIIRHIVYYKVAKLVLKILMN